MRPVSVFALANASPVDEARAHLRAFMVEMVSRAADSHAEGMNQTRAAAQVETLLDLDDDEALLALRDGLLSGGVLEVLSPVNAEGGVA